MNTTSLDTAPPSRASRGWVGLQLALGWFPVWVLYVTLILTSHAGTPFLNAAVRGLWVVGVAALLGMAVWRITRSLPWPRRFHWSFLVAHVGLAILYALAFAILTIGVEVLHAMAYNALMGQTASVVQRGAGLVSPDNVMPGWFVRFPVLGVWLYVMVAGVAYATRSTERAIEAEALAVRAQLAALRAQLHPHFLFNALHTVVHLIPRQPAMAARAAEQVAAMLRTTLDDTRDVVSVHAELTFVERYLEIEWLRFGDRLQVEWSVSDAVRDAELPSFAIQTLVENAVRHGAAPKVDPTELHISAQRDGDVLSVVVRDTGQGGSLEQLQATGAAGGLGRLRERLGALYGTAATLEMTASDAGVTARLIIPQSDRHRRDTASTGSVDS